MRRLIALLLTLSVALLWASPFPGQAQGSGREFQQLNLAFWPEFDRLSVLVIYRIELVQDTESPVSVRLPIPSRVGDPHAVAYRGEDGQLYDADYSLELGTEWSTIEVEMRGEAGQVEFYDPLTIEGAERSYQFNWPGGVSVEAFSYEVQRPPRATVFDAEPKPNTQTLGQQDGLTYVRGDLGSRAAEEGVDISFRYQKADDELTVDLLQPSPPLQQPQTGGQPEFDFQTILPWLLGGLGLLFIAGGVIWYFRSARVPAAVKVGGPQPDRPEREPGGSREIDASPVYCHECGTPAAPSDRFCRRCGAQLRQ